MKPSSASARMRVRAPSLKIVMSPAKMYFLTERSETPIAAAASLME